MTGDDITFSTTKLFHAYGLGNGLSFPLWVGATSVLMRGPTRPEPVLETLVRHRPTVFFSRPALYTALSANPDVEPASRVGPALRLGRRGAAAADFEPSRNASGSRSSTGSARQRCCTSTAQTRPAK